MERKELCLARDMHAIGRRGYKVLVMVSFLTWFMVSWMFTLSELCREQGEAELRKNPPVRQGSQPRAPSRGIPAETGSQAGPGCVVGLVASRSLAPEPRQPLLLRGSEEWGKVGQ